MSSYKEECHREPFVLTSVEHDLVKVYSDLIISSQLYIRSGK